RRDCLHHRQLHRSVGNDPSAAGIPALSLHDALPIYLLGLTGLPDPVGGDTPTPEGFFMNHPGWNPNDVVVTDTMRAMWANFARTGNPSIEGLDWPAYTSENDTYLRITPQPMVETGLDNAFPE